MVSDVPVKLEYYKVIKRDHRKMHPCHFNEGVQCPVKRCYECGWNPKVAAIRMEEILEKMRAQEETEQEDTNGD